MTQSKPNLGKHVIVDLEFLPADVKQTLNDPTLFRQALRHAIDEVGATVINVNEKDFGPLHGFTLNFSLSESHATVHTWPEHRVATMDIYMCGDCDSNQAFNVFMRYLSSKDAFPCRIKQQVLFRGESML